MIKYAARADSPSGLIPRPRGGPLPGAKLLKKFDQNFCRRPHVCGAEMARSAFRKSFCPTFFKKLARREAKRFRCQTKT